MHQVALLNLYAPEPSNAIILVRDDITCRGNPMRRVFCALGLLLTASLLANPARSGESARERIDSGAAWEEFCDRLKEPGKEILRQELPDSDLDRAEGYRYVLQRLSTSINEMLDVSTGSPLVTLYSHKVGKFGMDSADAKYSVAYIHGDGTYRVYGTLSNAHHIAFQLVTSRGGYRAFSSINREEMPVDASGGFELLVSRKRPEDWKGAWLQLDPRSTELIFREYFYDWENERISEFMIERLDDPGNAVAIGPVEADALLREITDAFAAYVPKWFPASLNDRNNRVNQLSPPFKSASEGMKDNAYGSGWFRLEPDEALLIELDEPDAHLWSFELGNFWWESLDYVNHTSSLNGFQAVRSSDNRYRLVISLEDPGVPNWLDPVGHPEGVIIYRYQRAAAENPVPSARLVKRTELQDLLPKDTPRVGPDARRAEIEMRQRHAARRWAP